VPGEDSHENDNPTNDIHKVIADNCTGLICGGGLVVTLFLSFFLCFCCYRHCCAPKKTKAPRTYTEVELSVGPSYKDDFVDEDDDDDAEYGQQSSTFKDI
jgi:hypothetical protein